MNQITRRTMLQRGSMAGAVLALDGVRPVLAGTRPVVSPGYFWLDPVKHVTGAFFTRILPFYDERIVALYGEFERGLYAGLA